MRAKALFFVTLSFMTWLIVSHFMTQSLAKPTEDLVPLTPISEGYVEFSGLNEDNTLTVSGTLTINAELTFYDTSMDQSLTWFLEIRSANAEPDGSYPIVWNHIYDDQTFGVAKGNTVNPTFTETVNLLPGVYYVKVGTTDQSDVVVAEESFILRVN